MSNLGERSKQFGLELPVQDIRYEKRFITEKSMAALIRAVRGKFGAMQVTDIAFRCLALNLEQKPIVEKIFACPAYYTFGYVRTLADSDLSYFQDENSLKSMMARENNMLDLNLHVWLTLPSLEIIDSTFMSSLGLKSNIPSLIGSVIASHPSELKNGMEFHPMLIGEGYLSKIGAIQ